MSTTNSTMLVLRYATILLALPSSILISTLTALTFQQHRLCLLLCLPLAASSVVNCYVLWKTRQQQRNSRTSPLDVALVLALDVIIGSVLLLTTVAGWFIMRAELMVDVQAGRAAYAEEHAYGRWAVAPLVLSFCIHYFLAFASLETGMFVQPVLAYALDHRMYADQGTPLLPIEISEKQALRALETESPV